MPNRDLTQKQQKAYDEALKRIEACRRAQNTELSLRRLGLTRLPPEITQLSHLTGLFLERNKLITLPPEIGQFVNLAGLYLSDNQLSTLPLEIGRLANLTRLDLDSNLLTTLSPGIGRLVNLRMLNLGGNQLKTLPPEIGQLANLTKLHLSRNRLSTLPPEMGRLAQLEDLMLENNRLCELPESLMRLARLRQLMLHGNTLGLPDNVLGPPWLSGGEVPSAKPQKILDYYFTRLKAPPTEPDPSHYDVFISVKSEDYPHARMAAAFLREAGLRVFFSEQELPKMGNSDFFDAIDTALESSRHMLVVTTSRAHVRSQWVKKEWQTYLNEKLSGRKIGNLVTLLCGSVKIGDLPLSLRQHEARPSDDLPSLLNYFQARGS